MTTGVFDTEFIWSGEILINISEQDISLSFNGCYIGEGTFFHAKYDQPIDKSNPLWEDLYPLIEVLWKKGNQKLLDKKQAELDNPK